MDNEWILDEAAQITEPRKSKPDLDPIRRKCENCGSERLRKVQRKDKCIECGNFPAETTY
jgi:hypothetical protein